ncbi:MAG: hypothetical protein NVS4B6_22210 [Mycobacterium sp.]
MLGITFTTANGLSSQTEKIHADEIGLCDDYGVRTQFPYVVAAEPGLLSSVDLPLTSPRGALAQSS